MHTCRVCVTWTDASYFFEIFNAKCLPTDTNTSSHNYVAWSGISISITYVRTYVKLPPIIIKVAKSS